MATAAGNGSRVENIQKLKAKLEDLEEDRTWRQSRVKDWEEDIATYSEKIDAISTRRWERDELKERLQRKVWNIQGYKKALTKIHQEIADIVARIERLDSEETQWHHEATIKEGSITLKIAKTLFLGLESSGKIKSLGMILEKFPCEGEADIYERKYNTVLQTDIDITDTQSPLWMSKGAFFKRLVYTVAQSLPSHITRSLSHPPGETTCTIPDCILKLEREITAARFICSKTNPCDMLNDSSLVNLALCDVKTPPFLGVLPIFFHHLSLGVFAIRLNERLDDHPTITYYLKDGSTIGYKSNYSNEQIIRYSLRAAMSIGRKDFKFLFLGTRTDHVQDEAIGKKSLRLRKIVRSFKMTDKVIFYNKEKNHMIFPLSVNNPEKKDWEVMDLIKYTIVQYFSVPPIQFPIKWLAIEMVLLCFVRETKQTVLLESTLYDMMAHFHFDRANFKAALKFLHQKRRIFYLEKGVVVAMQVILEKLNELIHHILKLSARTGRSAPRHIPSTICADLDNTWKKFYQYGIINEQCLEKFPSHYIDGVFTPKELLQVFVQTFIAFELGQGDFLVPCLMPSEKKTDWSLESEAQTVPPMVLEFPDGGPMMGVYFGLICYLMTTEKWQPERNQSGEFTQFTRSSVHFLVPHCFRGKVTINDPLSSFLVITYDGSTEEASEMCPLIRDTVLAGIKEVSKKLCYFFQDKATATLCENQYVSPKTTFLCMCGTLPHHPSIMSSDGVYLKCPYSVTTNHMTWFRGKVPGVSPKTEDSVSKVCPLKLKYLIMLKWEDGSHSQQPRIFSLRDKVSSKWRDFGTLLDITDNNLDAMARANSNEPSSCWNRVMQHWLNRGCMDYPVSWDGLYCLLEDVQCATVAEELRKAVDLWVGPYPT